MDEVTKWAKLDSRRRTELNGFLVHRITALNVFGKKISSSIVILAKSWKNREVTWKM